VSDIDIAVVDSLKALDPERPIREADISTVVPRVCSALRSGHSIKHPFGELSLGTKTPSTI
jgi:hypothetical protein